MYASFRCQGCKHTQRLYANHNGICVRCGGHFERIPEHPLMAGIGGGWPELQTNERFNQKIVDHHVENLLDGIEKRLAAEIEMDKIELMWYNEEKGGSSGEEEDNRDSVSIRQVRPVDRVRTDSGA